MPSTRSQLWLLALVAWGAAPTFQAHQKCACYFSNGSADCCGGQVFDGVNLDTNQIFKWMFSFSGRTVLAYP